MKKNYTTYYIIGGLIIVAAGFIWLGSKHSQKAVPTIANPETLPGIQTGEAPWAAELTNLRDRLQAIGLQALSAEGAALHIHEHLDIFIHGQQSPMPAGIGINTTGSFITPIHVHDATQVIHVESPTIQTYTLGQLFDIWGVRFSADCLGAYCKDSTNALRVFVNGKTLDGDPRQLALEPHQEIVVTYGTEAQLPQPMPASYAFEGGL